MTTRLLSGLLGGVALLALTAAPAVAADPDLTVFDWAGYEDPAFHQDYLEKHSDSPSFAYFGDEEEAFQKLRAGFRADLGHPCSQSRSEEHTSELQSLMRISYAVFCLKKKNKTNTSHRTETTTSK